MGVLNGYNMSSQPWLKIDVNGNRFCNESSPYDFVFHAASKLPNNAWYVVWDSNYIDDVDRFHTVGCSTQLLREGGDQMMGGTPEEHYRGHGRAHRAGAGNQGGHHRGAG